MNDKHTELARIMGNITIDILCSSDEFRSLAKSTQLTVSTRMGSGRATYCKFNRSTNNIVITFGKKMIRSKFSPIESKQWLSYREIIKHNYFQGNTSLSHVLAHTICHEYAHALQQIQGLVFKGSIHNKHFYQILDQLHDSGLAMDVKQALETQCDEYSINLAYDDIDIENMTAELTVFHLNESIQFKHKNKLITARIIKINPKTLTVESKGMFRTTRWRVSKHHATPC